MAMTFAVFIVFGDAEVYAPDLIGYDENRDLQPDGWALQDQAEHVATFIGERDNGPGVVRGREVDAPSEPEWSQTFDCYVRAGFDEAGSRLR